MARRRHDAGMYHLSHLIAADLGRERVAVRSARDPRPRRLPFGVLRGARMLRRAPRVAA
jgi:hypothetical protein